MIKIKASAVFAFVLTFASASSIAAENLNKSGKNEIFDNPFIAYGFNPANKLVTGYLIGLRTAPGRTDECRLVFAGRTKNLSSFLVRYLSEYGGYDKDGSSSPAAITAMSGNLFMNFKKDEMGGECEWILPFINEPRVEDSAGRVSVSFGSMIPGDWIGVYAIGSKRAHFYQSTDESSAKKVFLIQGDLIYVYDEKPGWYYVRFEGRKTTTVGWIRKSDTVQIEDNYGALLR